jgi:signal transduction histidine kinase
MMTKIISLKQAIRNNLIILGILVTLCYVGLITLSYSFGLEKVIELAGRVEGMMIERELLENPNMPLPQTETQSVYREWENVPLKWQTPFNDIVLSDAQQYETTVQVGKHYDYVSLNHYFMNNGTQLFIFSRMTEDEIDYLIKGVIGVGLNYLLIGVALIFLLLLCVIILLAKRITSPVLALNTWAGNLGSELHPKHKNFSFTELNQLADSLIGAINRSAALADREHAFLKHSSHELRTPLAVMQASLDTLQEQHEKNGQTIPRPLARALRASKNMRNITHTLLWLARESPKPLVKEPCDLHQLINEQLESHQYLLSDKDVTVTVKNRTDKKIAIEIELLRIVVANLIRNALQYTEQGKIEVEINHHGLNIINSINPEEPFDTQQPGFGLGLQLVKRICERSGWRIKWHRKTSEVEILINLLPTSEND